MTSRLLHIAMILAVLAGFPLSGVAQSVYKTEKNIREGNKLYEQQKYNEAGERYGSALEYNPNEERALFNQGNNLYKQQEYEKAIENFEIAAGMLEDAQDKAKAFHNIGNAHFEAKAYEKSVDAYKQALRLYPHDEETKYNLQKALSMLQQQQQQDQENEQDQDDNQDQENKQDQQDQQSGQNSEDQQQNGEKNQEQQQDQQEGQGNTDQQEEKDGDQQNMPSPSKLSKEEAERILQALENQEDKVQGEIIKKKLKPVKSNSDKDW